MADRLSWYSWQSLRTCWKIWWPSILVALLALAVTVALVWWGYDDWRCGDSVSCIEQPKKSYTEQSRGEIVRNYGLIIAAFWGGALAVWRGQIANRQAETSEQGLRNERFQKGADMLGNKTVAVRMGGIYALERLAQDHPEYYLDQVIKLLAIFVRQPTLDGETGEPDSGQEKRRPFRKDVGNAIYIITELNNNEIIEHDRPDLSGCNFSNMSFFGANLASMNLISVQFSDALLIDTILTDTDLFDAVLINANLTDANLTGAHLTGANLTGTVISGTDFFGVAGLAQEQLDGACQVPDRPPKNLPDDLDWNEEAAIERWKEKYQSRNKCPP